MAGAHTDISKHIKVYLMVFAALAAATVITVAAARVDLGGHTNVIVAMLIASIKATLVALIFMHLKWERSHWIWYSLGLCAIFFVALLALPSVTSHDLPALTRHSTWDVKIEPKEGHGADTAHSSSH